MDPRALIGPLPFILHLRAHLSPNLPPASRGFPRSIPDSGCGCSTLIASCTHARPAVRAVK